MGANCEALNIPGGGAWIWCSYGKGRIIVRG